MKKAVIFDMDGVISDTQRFHAKVESNLLSQFNIILSPDEVTQKYAGVSDEKMFLELFAEYGVTNYDMKELIKMKWDMMKDAVEGNIIAIPGVTDLIYSLKQKKIGLAVASASTLSFIRYVLKSLTIQNYFNVLVSSEEVKHSKPSPDLFLLAAKRLRVSPENCVVIEDGKSGMIGAKSAGMKCIGLVQSTESYWPADLLTTSLQQITVTTIEELF